MRMSDITVEFEFTQSALPVRITEAECREIVTRVLRGAKDALPPLSEVNQTVFVCFTDDEEIRRINLEQREIDRATDVLSFPMLDHKDGVGKIDPLDLDPESGTVVLGDILISLNRVTEQAAEYGHSQERELAFLACHGYLHLRGFDHIEEADAEQMNAVTEKILTELGYAREDKGV